MNLEMNPTTCQKHSCHKGDIMNMYVESNNNKLSDYCLLQVWRREVAPSHQRKDELLLITKLVMQFLDGCCSILTLF